MVNLTEPGRLILTEIANLNFLALTITSDNKAFNKRITDEQEKRKAATLEKMHEHLRSVIDQLGSGQKPKEIPITFTGKSGEEENKKYTETLERFVNESLVSRSIDLYHLYLRKVIALALNRDPSLIRAWALVLDLSKKKVTEIETASTWNQAISRLFPKRENVFRNLVHEHLNVPHMYVIPLLVEVRNCIVHHLGEDLEGKASLLASENPEIGIRVCGGHVSISNAAVMNIVGRVLSDISIIDQCVGTVLGLPTTAEPTPVLSRSYN